MERARARLEDNRVLAIALCRLVPGLLFSTFAGCGWLGIPFLQFLVPAVITSAVYTGLMLFLVLHFGAAIFNVGHLGWSIASGLLLVFTLEAADPAPAAPGHRERAGAGRARGRRARSAPPGMPPVPWAARRCRRVREDPSHPLLHPARPALAVVLGLRLPHPAGARRSVHRGRGDRSPTWMIINCIKQAIVKYRSSIKPPNIFYRSLIQIPCRRYICARSCKMH